MTVSLTVQQKQAIAEYRQQNNISSTVSDSQVVQQMITSGKIPACFSSLAVGKTSNANKNDQIFTKNTSAQTSTSQNQNGANPLEKQLAAFGLINRNGAGEKIKIGDQEFTVIGEATNGRKIVQDAQKQIQIISHDNKILDKNYVLKKNASDAVKNDSQVAQNTTLKLLDAYVKNAEKDFQDQLAKDGWAGDFADGISVLWGSDNRASKVSKDIDKYKKDIEELRKAAEKGDKNFNEKFKKMFGIEFNQEAIANYIQNPSEENYQKAFGTKNNITERVNDYNKSQQTGASVVKGTATVGAGIAIGVATGGTGLVGLGAAAAATGGASAAINISDRLTSDVGLQEGELQDILVSAAWDGASVIAGGAVGKIASTAIKGGTTAAAVGRTAINTAGDVAMGAAQELAETGSISAEGVIINAAMGGVGGAASEGGLRKIKHAITKEKTPTTSNQPSPPATTPIVNENGDEIAGGIFGSKNSSKPSFIERMLGSGKKNTELTDAEINKKVKQNLEKSRIQNNGDSHQSQKLSKAMDPSKPLVKDLGENVDIKNISKHVEPGEVCAVGTPPNQKLYVNNNGNAVEIKLSRDKFEELFSQKGLAMAEQKGLNNCWLLSKINAMTESASGRAQIYSMFEELPNGDIKISLENSDPITFPGGKPADAANAKLGQGAAPGIEMLQQAVLIRTLKGAEGKVDNIAKLDYDSINKATDAMNTDATATKYLLGDNVTTKTVKAPLQNNPTTTANYEKELENALNNFKNGQDIGTAIWGAHSRTIVNYDPKTKMVTYHDPYNGGVDVTCSLDEFKKSSPTIYISQQKNQTTAQNVPQQESPKVNSAPNDTPIEQTPPQKTTDSNDISLPNGYRKGKGLGGQPTIVGPNNELFMLTSSGWEPINRKAMEIADDIIPQLKTPNSKSQGVLNQSDAPTQSNPTSKTTATDTNTTPQPQQLAIPKGFKEYGKIMGKRAIIGPDNVVMYESKGSWKRIN